MLAASRSFYSTFKVNAEQTTGSLLFTLCDGQWVIPALRLLLETIIPERTAMDGFEVVHDFPTIGRRTMLVKARKVIYDDSPKMTNLLAFTDITDRRAIETAKEHLLARTEDLLRQKDVLLREMEHRVTNSLQMIASILLLKARSVTSEETRQHLKEAHQRVLSVAEVQRHLHSSSGVTEIEVASYLSKLCESLAGSMVVELQAIEIKVTADSVLIGSERAVSLGLIATELMLNAIKYAFSSPKAGAHIFVTYEASGNDWELTVSDNGVGKDGIAKPVGGLGTAIVEALVRQLDARIDVVSSSKGTKVSIAKSTFLSRLPEAA